MYDNYYFKFNLVFYLIGLIKGDDYIVIYYNNLNSLKFIIDLILWNFFINNKFLAKKVVNILNILVIIVYIFLQILVKR